MIKKSTIYITMMLFLSSCIHQTKKELRAIDTVGILTEVLQNKNFLKENSQADTLYLIKSKFYNNNYPDKIRNFSLRYIDDIPLNKIFNHPYKQKDKRTRLDITQFNNSKDTVVFSIKDYGVNMDYQYKLIYEKGKWHIVNEKIILY